MGGIFGGTPSPPPIPEPPPPAPMPDPDDVRAKALKKRKIAGAQTTGRAATRITDNDTARQTLGGS